MFRCFRSWVQYTENLLWKKPWFSLIAYVCASFSDCTWFLFFMYYTFPIKGSYDYLFVTQNRLLCRAYSKHWFIYRMFVWGFRYRINCNVSVLHWAWLCDGSGCSRLGLRACRLPLLPGSAAAALLAGAHLNSSLVVCVSKSAPFAFVPVTKVYRSIEMGSRRSNVQKEPTLLSFEHFGSHLMKNALRWCMCVWACASVYVCLCWNTSDV